MASKKAPKKSINKSAFVRDPEMLKISAAAVVAAAKEKGIKLTEAYVYTIRSTAKKSKSAGVRAKKTNGASHISTPSETGFIEFILNIGTRRAQELLNDVKTRVVKAVL